MLLRRHPHRWLTLALLGTAVLASTATAQVAGPVNDAFPVATAVGFLNAQRAANGLPADLTIDAAMSEGCRKHETDYQGTRSQNPHDELPSRPGYSPEGQQAARSSELVLGRSMDVDAAWSRDGNPWSTGALFHLQGLFKPGATTAWWGFGPNGMCMGTGDGRAFTTPAFFSYPGNGTAWAPASDQIGELPFSPIEVLGLPALTGPGVIVWAAGIADPRIASASLTEADSSIPIPVRWADASTPIPPSLSGGEEGATLAGFGDAGYVIPPRPLTPGRAYVLNVDWTDATGHDYQQTIQFSTNGAPPQTTVDTSTGAFVLRSRSQAPAEVVVRDSISGPTIATATLRNGQSLPIPRGGGRFAVCHDQPASGHWGSTSACAYRAVVNPTFGIPRVIGRQLAIPVRSPLTTTGYVKFIVHRATERDGHMKNLWPSTIREGAFNQFTTFRVPLGPRSERFEITMTLYTLPGRLSSQHERIDPFRILARWVLRPGSNRAVLTDLKRMPYY
jgi:hypothetical protein